MRSLSRVTALHLVAGCIAFATPLISQAQTETIDFSGVTAQSNITFGSLVPEGYQLPGTFSGSFLYDPSASSHFISDVILDYGTFQLAQSTSTVDAGFSQISNGTVSYGNSLSTGLTGSLSALEIMGFQMTFAGPTNGQVPAAPGAIDFNDFSSRSVEFDVAGVPTGGEIHGVGDITAVRVPEPSSLSLLAVLLAVPLAIGLKRRRAVAVAV